MTISSSNLIRWGGLAAIVGGALYALQSLRIWPSHPENVFFLFLVLGAMAAIAAIAALAVLERERWKLAWMLVASLVAFVGIALMLVEALTELAVPEEPPFVVLLLFFVGLLVGTLGIVALGILVMGFGVLPWWGGAALIAGSPLVALLLWRLLLLRLPVDLTGVVWAVVGYAVFRAAERQRERPPRVR